MSLLLSRLLVAASLLILPLVAACDDEGDEPTRSPGITTQTPNIVPSIGGPQNQPDPPQELTSSIRPTDGVVELEASGSQFVENAIQLDTGETAVIRVTNNDSGVRHNLRIAGVDGEFQTEDDAVTTPDAIDGGASGELTFSPPANGSYTFRCDFHPGSMGGQIVVGE